MNIHFHKYQGTGNDFILIDNRQSQLRLAKEQVAFLCHRHYGIGADGLMLLQNEEGHDFRMVYYNSDGGESTMCGNGGRCITAFAQRLGMIANTANFVAIDGPHSATIAQDGIISLKMVDVIDINHHVNYSILNTGSPHYVAWVEDAQEAPVVASGREIRYANEFAAGGGINVNFVQKLKNGLLVRTYERGVEDETLSCGTGVTASAIAASGAETGSFSIPIQTPGGNLNVSFTKPAAGVANDVVLSGPATFVFEGDIELK
ncbi:MAG: diaminopimelate epimerase [Sphingobacteriales bacterium]|nr:MAG: diaminopimelate epimerase [Sphingobacteriales bacterium]